MDLEKKETFDLSTLPIESLFLHESISPQTKPQYYSKPPQDPLKLLFQKDPYEILGFNDFSEPRNTSVNEIGTPIQEFYRGLNIFITGGTGFLGKILLERLIRLVPHIGNIYLLIRGKRGKTPKQRLEEMLTDQVFLRMRTEVPEYQSKIFCVEGDISEPGLGLSMQDRHTLQEEVNVVFHSAADVRFINTLRNSISTNLIGSKRVLDLAKTMKHLKSYVHLSTAYSNCVRRVIEEKCYQMSTNYKDILKYLDEKTDEEIAQEEARVLEGWPNAYTFSKALCENMILEEGKSLPICIFRPSIVWPTWKEPLKVWTDNIYGPNGMLLAIQLGILHIVVIDKELTIDCVPVDLTVNAMIAAGWENATDRPKDNLLVYNFTSSLGNPVLWKKIQLYGYKWVDLFPYDQAIWYTSVIPTKNYTLNAIGHFVLHKIPGAILDRIACMTGREPRLTKIYNKMDVLKEKLDDFLFRVWEFKNENTKALWNKLSERDKEIFYFDLSLINLEEYFVKGKLGYKYFYLKESLENMPFAQKKWMWLKWAHRSFLVVSGLVTLKLMVTIARVLPI